MIRYCDKCGHPEHVHEDNGCNYVYKCECKKYIRRTVGVDY